MFPIIEFCLTNIAIYSQAAYEKLMEDDSLDVLEYSCTSNCETCAQTLFCIVEGEIITGNNNEELVANVYKFLEDHPIF